MQNHIGRCGQSIFEVGDLLAELSENFCRHILNALAEQFLLALKHGRSRAMKSLIARSRS
jgi:hypothetical protein